MPLVSVIVPSYNHAPFLRERMESIINQTFQNFELILLDDHSTDGSIEILQQFSAHPKVSHFIVNEKNTANPFVQWQRGIDLSAGQFIWIAESDDTADLHFLEILVSKLKDDSRLGLVYCKSKPIDAHGNTIEHVKEWTADLNADLWRNDFLLQPSAEMSNYFFSKNFILNASGVVFRKELLKQSGWKASTFRYVGDWWAWIDILHSSSLFYFSTPYNFHRSHQQTTRVRSKEIPYLEEEYALRKLILEKSSVDDSIKQSIFNRLAKRLVKSKGFKWLMLTRPGIALCLRLSKIDSRLLLRIAKTGFSKLIT